MKTLLIIVALAIGYLSGCVCADTAATDSSGSGITARELDAIKKQAINPDGQPVVEIAPEVWQVLTPKQTAALYQRAADGKNADAMALLGLLYGKGMGVPRDRSKALALFKQSAELQSGLGMFMMSLTSSRDSNSTPGEAEVWLKKSADAGYGKALTELGVREYQGVGAAPNPLLAAQYFNRAASAGDPDAYDFLGQLSMSGAGVPQSTDTAFKDFNKAAESGSARGAYDLGMAYMQGVGVKVDNSKAFESFQKAANGGFALGMLNTGALLENGQGVAKDEAKAAEWYQKAADAGVAAADDNLAQLYEDGRGVPKDHAKAVALMQTAASGGDMSAAQWLAAHHESP